MASGLDGKGRRSDRCSGCQSRKAPTRGAHRRRETVEGQGLRAAVAQRSERKHSSRWRPRPEPRDWDLVALKGLLLIGLIGLLVVGLVLLLVQGPGPRPW